MFYVQDDLKQGSQRWLHWRKGVIGASEAGSIIGENPWCSAEYLMKEKLGLVPAFQGNANTREGQRLEPEARSAVEQFHSTRIRPQVIQDGELPFLAASLDGITGDLKTVYEIKCGRSAYERTKSTGQPPFYDAAQLQHILMITGLDRIYFVAYRPALPLIVLSVQRSAHYIKRLRKAEEKFVKKLVRRGHMVQDEFVGRRVRADK